MFTRTRYQKGSLKRKQRKDGSKVWEFRWYEPGSKKRRTIMLGSQYTSESAAKKAPEVQAILFRVNSEHPRAEAAVATVGMVISRYVQEELLQHRLVTQRTYQSLIRNHIAPRWAETKVDAVGPLAVEKWIAGLKLSPKTKKHVRGVTHLLFECAHRWQWINNNPIESVRVKEGGRRKRRPRVLMVPEFHLLLTKVKEPYRTRMLIGGCLGLRVCEIASLKWEDFDFDAHLVLVTRSVVQGQVGKCKTEASEEYLPLDPRLEHVLKNYKGTCYRTVDGWLFANPKTGKPYTTDSIQKKHIRPNALEAGLGDHIGWHTLRHSYRSWLQDTGASPGVQQALMRHADIGTTMNVYGRTMDAAMMAANQNVVNLAILQQESAMGVNGSSMAAG